MNATRTQPGQDIAAPASELTKYIRVRSRPDARFVEFDFAINDPGLFVELVLPRDAFDTFCAVNQVVTMTREQTEAIDAELDKWRYGEETLMSRNRDQAQ
ncbi:phenol hydroxylase subunit [Zobellella sp. DQSA1]|uniref:phenol hydroxylase subunit n=1 Tax=Zobellella sp. DQSA1 TaxID=3342386 RepID=UPI0035C24FC3